MTLTREQVTVVIPSIPPRAEMLTRALASVKAQTWRPFVLVQMDLDHEGAAVTRNKGLQQVETEWVAFLDDDDEFKPHHIALLITAALSAKADYVYSWYDVVGGLDPLHHWFGKPWSNDEPHQTTITTLVRTDLAKDVGFDHKPMPDPNGGGAIVGGEDYRFTLGCMEKGAKIHHVPNRSWNWHHHGANTSGLGNRWKD